MNLSQLKEQVRNILRERSVKAIQKDYSNVVSDMEKHLDLYKKSKGTPEEKKHIGHLKTLTAKKKSLQKELDLAVAGLYKNAELKVDESVNEPFRTKVLGEANRRSTDFFEDGKYGKELNKLFGGKFDGKKFDKFIDAIDKKATDVQFERILNFMGGQIGMNIRSYDNKPMQVFIDDLKKEVEKLYKIHNESVNETFIPKVGTIDDYKLKDLLMKNPKVNAVLGNNEKSFMKKSDVVVIGHQSKRFNTIFTDGKQEFEIDMKVEKLVKPLSKARKEIIAHFSKNESVNEAKTYKKGDKLKIKLPNGKKFDVVFDMYSRTKGVALGKFKDGSGEYNTKPFNLDTIVESVNEAELKLGVRYVNKQGKEGFIQTGGSTNPKNWFWSDGKTKHPYDKVKKELKPAKDQKKTGFSDYLKQGGRVWDNVNPSDSLPVNESSEPEIISQLKDIVKNQQYQNVKDPKSGKKMKVDMQTANAVLQIYNGLSNVNKGNMVKMGLPKMIDVSFKIINKYK